MTSQIGSKKKRDSKSVTTGADGQRFAFVNGLLRVARLSFLFRGGAVRARAALSRCVGDVEFFLVFLYIARQFEKVE